MRAIRACARLASSRVTHSCPQVKALAGTRSRRSLRRLWRPRSSNPAAPIQFAPSFFLRKVRTLRLGFFIGACDPRVRASRFIPRHSLLPASQSTCGHSLATQSAPSVAPKVVKSGRPDSFRSKFFFVQSTNFATGLFHFVCDSRSSKS